MLDALAGSYPPEIDAGAVPGHLQLLAHLDLTPLTDAAVRAYAFKHAMTQKVAYASLLAAQRQAAHDRAGDWFERTTPDNYSLLAYHYGRGANREKQRLYLRRAADAAQSNGRDEDVVALLERDVIAVRRRDDFVGGRKAQVFLLVATIRAHRHERSAAATAPSAGHLVDPEDAAVRSE